MVYVVNGVLASGMDMLLKKDLVGFALQKMEIHPLMLLTLSMIFQTFSPTLRNPNTNHTCANYVGMILTMLEDSLIMGNEELSTIPKKKSDEFIKSNVEDLVPIPSKSEDTSESDSDNDLPSDNESLSDEDVPEDNFKIYSNPLFEFDDEYISNDINPLFDEVLEDIECKDSYVSNLDETALFYFTVFLTPKKRRLHPSSRVHRMNPPLEEKNDLLIRV
ncbi:hypothetical protein Tco_0487290 [Tanacetum coccineum]